MKKLAIIAGSGALPRLLAEACAAQGRACCVIVLEGAGDAAVFSAYPHRVIRLGAIGESLEYMRAEGAQAVVMAGGVKRPKIGALMPDAVGTKVIARLGMRLLGGDDAVLRGIIEFLESEGFAVQGAEELLGGLLAPEGILTRTRPDIKTRDAIAIGMRAAKAIGARDQGQAVIVEADEVIAQEDAAGTDAMIARTQTSGKAFLVKARKPSQDARADLPSIGVHTIEALHAAGMQGVAVEADAALLIEKDALLRAADRHRIWVCGVHAE